MNEKISEMQCKIYFINTNKYSMKNKYKIIDFCQKNMFVNTYFIYFILKDKTIRDFNI